MKKLIFSLLTTTFIVIGFLSIKQFEFLQFQTFNNDSASEEWSIDIKSGDPQKSKSENFSLLAQVAIEAKVNFQRTSYERDNNNAGKTVYYVAFFERDTYFDKIKLKTGKFINVNSNPNEFMSTINTNSKNQTGQLEIFHSFDPIEVRPIVAAEKVKDVSGTYTVNGEENAEKLKEMALKYGFTVDISKDQSQTSITQYPYQEMIYKATLILCLLIALAMLYDVINNYKEIAARYLLGYNFWEIGYYLFKKYIKVLLGSLSLGLSGLIVSLYFYNDFQQLLPFLYFGLKNIIPLIMTIALIFIVTWLGTKMINISQMIKNKKPIKLLFYMNMIIRFILAVFLTLGLLQGSSTFFTLKNIVEKQEKWDILKDYSYLGAITKFTPELVTSLNNEKKQQFQSLYEGLESQGAFYIAPSNYYDDNLMIPLDSNPWGNDGKRVEINKNYLSINPIIGFNNEPVKIQDNSDSNEITVLVPQAYEEYENDIKETISKNYTGIYNQKDSTPPNVNILYVKNNQSYFSFSGYMAEKNNFEITDPIAIVVNSKFDSSRLATSMAMGYGYYTKNSGNEDPFKVTKDTLEKYDFDEIWQPMSVAYSSVELQVENNKELLQFATIYCGIFVILAAVLLFFSAMYYLEMNKKLLALQWIFGYSFFEKHYLVYLAILVFWNITFAICTFNTSNTLLLAKIVLGLIFFDVLLISTILSVKEYNITKQMLIEE